MKSRLLLASSIAGCEGGSGVLGDVLGSTAPDAMALLPESVKQSVEGYLASVTSATDLLAGAQQYTDLVGMVPQLQPLIEQITQASQALSSLSPDMRQNVTEAFGSQLTDTNSMFTNQVDRLKSSLGLPPAVSDMLGGVNLFG